MQEYIITAGQFSGSNYTDIVQAFTKQFNNDSWANSSLIIDIFWTKQRDLYIDKVWIYNNEYENLFVADSATQLNRRNQIKNILISKFATRASRPQWSHLYMDEAFPHSARCVSVLSQLSKEALGGNKYVTGANNWHYFDQERYSNSIFRTPYIMHDRYALQYNTDSVSESPSTDKHILQQAFDDLISYDWGNSLLDGRVRNGLRQSIFLAQNETPDDYTDDVPFYFCMQTCSQMMVKAGAVTREYNRAPTYNEILGQGWLGMCYGAKGSMYYTIMTLAPQSYNTSEAWSVYGIFESLGQIGNISQDPKLEQVPNYRYYAVKELNRQVDQVSGTLLKLNWINAFSLHKDPFQCDYISFISSQYQNPGTVGEWIADPQGSNYIEAGLFKQKDAMDDENLDYFILVNRRCLTTEGRRITVDINKAGSAFNNWKITDIATDSTYIINKTGQLSVWLNPGTGKLFRLEPVMISGGTLAFDENLPAGTALTVKNSVKVPVGVKLSVTEGSTLSFADTVSLLIEGSLLAKGNPGNPVVFDFINKSVRSGIKLGMGGKVEMKHALIANAETALNCNYAPGLLKIDSSEFSGNRDAVSLYNFGDSVYIGHSVFTNNLRGLVAGVGTSLVLGNNVFHGNYAPISIFLTPNVRLVDNLIYADEVNGENGIYMQSSGGFLLGNVVTGYKKGLHCYGSSPEIGFCVFTNNSYYGLYSEGGSMPNLGKLLLPADARGLQGEGAASTTPMYVTVTGYNEISNNGSVDLQARKDPFDDGSEIKLFHGNIILSDSSSGDNAIYDDRDGTNTGLLISSRNYLAAILDGKGIYWGTQGFSGSRIQNIYRVLTDSLLITPPRPASVSGYRVFVIDSIFGTIDTLYATGLNGEEISPEELNRRTGTVKLLVNQPGSAEGYFNSALAAETDPAARFSILSKMYMLECLNDENSSALDSLRVMYLQNAGSYSDTTLVKAMVNLSVLCLLKSGRYEEAVTGFTEILNENVGSDAEVYAEIDVLMASYLKDLQGAVLQKGSNANIPVTDITGKLGELLDKASKKTEISKKAVKTVPVVYSVSQNFPNPFNPATVIQYQLPKEGQVKLTLFDILGREVQVLIDEYKTAGSYSHTFNGEGLASGVYIYRLDCNDFHASKKLTLLK